MNKSLFKISCFAFLLLSPLFFGLVSCKKEDSLRENEKMRLESNRTATNIISAEDYNSLEPQEKKIVEMLNSSILGIKGAAALNGKNISDFTAFIYIGKTDSKYDHVSVVFNDKEAKSFATTVSTICTLTELKSYLNKAKELMNTDKDEDFTICVTVNKDDCYDIGGFIKK